MKYIVVIYGLDGMHTKKCIDATSMTIEGAFVVFKNKTKVCIIDLAAILSISTEGYEPSDVYEAPESREAKNARLIEFYKPRT